MYIVVFVLSGTDLSENAEAVRLASLNLEFFF